MPISMCILQDKCRSDAQMDLLESVDFLTFPPSLPHSGVLINPESFAIESIFPIVTCFTERPKVDFLSNTLLCSHFRQSIDIHCTRPWYMFFCTKHVYSMAIAGIQQSIEAGY